jgi:hypothetical protein
MMGLRMTMMAALDARERRNLLGAGGVAVGAAEVAAGEAEEDLALADQEALALDGGEDFDDGGGHGAVVPLGGGGPLPVAVTVDRRTPHRESLTRLTVPRAI